MKYRTVCRDGRMHALFAVADHMTELRRAQQVVNFDDKQGCGPHVAERDPEDGFGWSEIMGVTNG